MGSIFSYCSTSSSTTEIKTMSTAKCLNDLHLMSITFTCSNKGCNAVLCKKCGVNSRRDATLDKICRKCLLREDTSSSESDEEMTKEERKEIRRKKNLKIADLGKKHTMVHVGTMKYSEG